jgi:UDP-N-acetylglucosamine---dolichyl-phosphate N-acetylglucosaminyltransferase
MKKHKVAFVIPAYNEEKMIGQVVKDLLAEVKKTHYDFEIVVVNDGSKDNTAKTAKTAGAKVINHILNSGSGGATSTGLSYAQQNNLMLPSLWMQMVNTTPKIQ